MSEEATRPMPVPGPCCEGALSLLLRFVDRIPVGGRVLEIGAGRGERALPLARRGCRVTAVESDAAAAAAVRECVAREGLDVTTITGDFVTAGIEGSFDAVLVFDQLHGLTRSGSASLFYRALSWVQAGGLLVLTAMHVDDFGYDLCRDTWRRVGLHSFRSPAGVVRTFLARNEILDLLIGWEIVHHCEGLGPAHSHGGGPSESHGVIEVVARRLPAAPR